MQRGLRTLQGNAEPPASAKDPWVASAGVIAARRVVIAEDDASMRRLMAHVLSPDGYELHEARDGREALSILRGAQTGALVLDLVMPGLSGWDVLEERMKDTALREVPVIVVSAKRGADIARALAYGVFGLFAEAVRSRRFSRSREDLPERVAFVCDRLNIGRRRGVLTAGEGVHTFVKLPLPFGAT